MRRRALGAGRAPWHSRSRPVQHPCARPRRQPARPAPCPAPSTQSTQPPAHILGSKGPVCTHVLLQPVKLVSTSKEPT